MLARVQHDATRVSALVTALEQHEITLDEFSDAVEFLTPEAIQVTSTILRSWAGPDGLYSGSLSVAACLCSRLASRGRSLS